MNSGSFKKGCIPWSKGKKLGPMSEKNKEKISLAHKGKIFTQEHRDNLSKALKGKKLSLEHKLSISKCQTGKKLSEKTKEKMRATHLKRVAEGKHNNYYSDRSKLKINNKGNNERRSSAYFYWRKSVWSRDNWKCKMSNLDCSGHIEAHHILSWIDFPELRYDINNGITLCHAHHPRKRALEKELAPIFKELIKV